MTVRVTFINISSKRAHMPSELPMQCLLAWEEVSQIFHWPDQQSHKNHQRTKEQVTFKW